MFSIRRAAALLSVVVVLVTACDVASVGAAAVVGGDRITVTELQDEVREVVAVDPNAGPPTGDQAELQRIVLSRMIAFKLRDQVERDAGISVSEADVDSFIAEQLEPQVPEGDLTPLLAQSALTEESLREAVREVLVAEQLGPAAYEEGLMTAAEELGVEVNPRYGSWEGAQISAGSGSISRTVELGG